MTYRDSASYQATANGGSLSFGSAVAGDYAIVFAGRDAAGTGTPGIADLTGWTTIFNQEETAGRALTVRAWRKELDSADITAGSVSVTHESDQSDDCAGWILIESDIDSTTPLDVAFVLANHYTHYVNDNEPDTPTINTATDSATVVHGGAVGLSGGNNTSLIPGEGTVRQHQGGASVVRIGLVTQVAGAAPDTIPANNLNFDGAQAGAESVGFVLTLRPAAPVDPLPRPIHQVSLPSHGTAQRESGRLR